MAEAPRPEEGQTQADMAPKLPVYEVGFHIVPTVDADKVSAMVEKVRKALGDAEVIAEGFPERRTLAYTIERASQGKREKYSEAYFGWIKFAAPREQAVKLAEALRGMKEILRHLIIETVREDITQKTVRAVFTSDRLEGQTLRKPTSAPEKTGEVSEEELNKSIEALTAE